MPKTRRSRIGEKAVQPAKFRIMFRQGPLDNRIEDYLAESGELPHVLYAPIPPSDFSEDWGSCQWHVAAYRRSTDVDEFDVQAFYDFIGISEDGLDD